MIEEQFLRDLQRDMSKLAHDTLLKAGTEREIYLAAGRYQGMLHAQAIMEKLVRGTEEP